MKIFAVTIEHITTRPSARVVIASIELSYDGGADCPALIITAPKSSLSKWAVAAAHRAAENCGASIEFRETDDAALREG